MQGRQFQLQQLGRAADAAQRVLDFMRQVADQLLVDLALVEYALLAVEFELLHVFAQLDQHAVARRVERADDAVHAQRLAPQALQSQVLAQVGKFMFERLRANAGQLVGIQEQGRQLLPRQGLQ